MRSCFQTWLSTATCATTQRRAVAAYAYLWPLVLMERTRLQVAPSANEFAHMLEFPDSAFRAVVNPNVDTLYSSAWLDVGAEPVVLSVPALDRPDRYYVVQVMDAWSNTYASLSPRDPGPGAGEYLFCGGDDCDDTTRPVGQGLTLVHF